jgi:hypothetical protein
VLIKPKNAAKKRIKRRVKTLKQTEEKTSQLLRDCGKSMITTCLSFLVNLEYSKTGTVTEDGHIDDLVDLFKGLQKDIGDQKAESVRLNRALRQEQDERKEEFARLNRDLLIEEEHRKDEKKDFIAKTRQLEAALTKEREERREVVANLEGTIEQQGAKLEECDREMKGLREQHHNDMRDISDV